MPVITFKYQDLKDLGIDMEKDELINTLPMMSGNRTSKIRSYTIR